MQPERWRQIDEILQSAIDCSPENRPSLLDSACGDDAELRREVESLLAHDKGDGFTAAAGFSDAVKVLEDRLAGQREGQRIGPYRVLREIGRGGMGTVYSAARADATFEKLVAIKIIRRGLDTDDILQRFQSERQILATLDHPNITRLLDGGTTEDGLPYFVMDYIEGRPIDTYCDAHKLNIAERLELFLAVCSAVIYAHQNLVIHRDIKPGNVLVTKEGVPRLLDFGIAKLLAPEAQEKTLTTLHPFTPQYASPEQVRGEAITTSSDVYSLGVLLYLLLTGCGPYRGQMSSVAEIERSICEEEPDKPSLVVRTKDRQNLSRRLRGDLDNIVLMALRKEPQRRYASAEQLAGDIRHHLSDFPVLARPDTLRYRVSKFIQRHKSGVAAATLIFLTLLAGIATTLWQAHIARLEQAKAARINAFLQEMVGYSAVSGGTPNHMAHDATVADMLDDAAQRVETDLGDQPEVKAEMLGTIGGTYVIQAKYDLARRYLQEAYDLDLRLYGLKSRQTAQVMHPLGSLAYMNGDYGTADSWFEKAIPIYRHHLHDADFEIRRFVALLSDAAFVKRALGRLDLAEGLWQEALTYGPLLPAKYRAQSIAPKTFLAQLYTDRGEIEKADRFASEASKDLRAFGRDRFSLAQSLIDLGNIRRLRKRFSEADALIQEGTSLYAQAQGSDHPNVAYGLTTLAMSRYDQGKYDLAEQDARRAQKIVEKSPSGHYYAGVYLALGRIVNKVGRFQEAESLLREALRVRKEQSPIQGTAVAMTQGGLGECLAVQKRYDEAEPLLLVSYATLEVVNVPDSPMLKDARAQLFALYVAWGRRLDSIRYAP